MVKYGVRDLLNRIFDSTIKSFKMTVASQDVTLLAKKTGTDVSRSVLASNASLAGTASETAYDWQDMDGYADLIFGVQAEIVKSVTGEVLASGDGSTTSFSGTITNTPIKPGTISVGYTIGGTAYTATDDGNGNISGTDCSGTINYDTGAWTLTFTTAPDNATNITAGYTYYLGDCTLKIEQSNDKSNVYYSRFVVNQNGASVISSTYSGSDKGAEVELTIKPLMRYVRLTITPDGTNDISALYIWAARRP